MTRIAGLMAGSVGKVPSMAPGSATRKQVRERRQRVAPHSVLIDVGQWPIADDHEAGRDGES